MKCQTFVLILLFYAAQNSKFFHYLFGDLGGTELGQMNFEVGLAHPAPSSGYVTAQEYPSLHPCLYTSFSDFDGLAPFKPFYP